jgi:hypothetical protein
MNPNLDFENADGPTSKPNFDAEREEVGAVG